MVACEIQVLLTLISLFHYVVSVAAAETGV